MEKGLGRDLLKRNRTAQPETVEKQIQQTKCRIHRSGLTICVWKRHFFDLIKLEIAGWGNALWKIHWRTLTA